MVAGEPTRLVTQPNPAISAHDDGGGDLDEGSGDFHSGRHADGA